MGEHLKDRQYYEDQVDRMVVADCRRQERYYVEAHKSEKNKEEAAQKAAVYGYVSKLEMMMRTLDWHNRRENIISNWMHEDEAKDKLLQETGTPENILCDTCYDRMIEDLRTIDEYEGKVRVLFFMRCPNDHLPLKGVYEDGTAGIPSEFPCPECKAPLDVENLPAKKNVMRTKYSCPKCPYEDIDEYEFGKSEKPDPDFKKDRARFCLSGEALKEAQDFKQWCENAKSLMDDIKHKEEHKEEYDAVANLEKLTIPQVKARITDLLADTEYTELSFEKPVIERFVSMEFSVEEMETENQRASCADLKKRIKECLEPTNWRLMTGGIDYRLGLLTGHLRAYESEEDMLKLVK